jgi:ankyrin repeat protein
VYSSVAGADFDYHNPFSASALSQRVRDNDFEGVQKLLEEGHNPDVPDNRGWTSLHEAATKESLNKTLKALLEAGAYVDHRNVEGETPLYLACSNGAKKNVSLLIKNKADVNKGDMKHMTPLHVSSTNGDVESMKALLRAGAQIDAKDWEERTPLFYAVEKSKLEAVKLLLEKGASVNFIDHYKRTPLQVSCSVGNVEVFEALLEKCGGLKEDKSGEGFTPLMEAVQWKHLDLAERLLQLGADANIADERGLLALHLASHSGSSPLFHLLFSHTSREAIVEYCGYDCKLGLRHPRSLPCLLIETNPQDCLATLLSSGLPPEVLQCPVVPNESEDPMDPISFLLSRRDQSPEQVTWSLGLLLDAGIPTDYYYPFGKSVSCVEELMRRHVFCEPSCRCVQHLKTLLRNGADPDWTIDPDGLPAFIRPCIASPHLPLLSLLLSHSNTADPHLMAVSLFSRAELDSRCLSLLKRNIPLTGRLPSFCYKRAKEFDMELHRMVQAQLRTPLSLRHASRLVIRNYLRQQFQNNVRLDKFLARLNIPVSLVNYLRYMDL